jgi:hypothetical protein
MSEQVVAPAEAVDPFEGKEVSFEEFSNYRKTGEVPERIKAEAPKEPPVAQAETVDGEEPAKEAEQEQKEPERNEKGQFKAKEKPAEFSPEQQQVFDRAFSKREAKIRREYEARIADLTSKQTGTAPDKPTIQPDAPPKRPELPKLSEFAGTLEDFDKEVGEYPAKLAAYLDAERQQKERVSSVQKRIDASEAKAKKAHPDYADEFKALQDDIQSNEEPRLPDHVIKAIAEETDDPHEVTYYLAKNREEFRRFASLTPDQAAREAIRLDTRLALQAAAPAPDKKPAEPKPKPPAPVGGRASATAFDVNDTSTSADEWAKQRNEQLAKRRGR